MKLKRRAKAGDAHVRVYGYELTTPAYRTLSPDARALLVEFRALFNGGENRVFLSVREMMTRVGIGQRRAEHARDQLLDRGWVRVIEAGAFHRKSKVATVYALNNEPLQIGEGATAPKDYMRWQPSEFFTVAATATDGSCQGYRDPSPVHPNRPNGSRHSYRKRGITRSTVAATATQIELPRGHSARAGTLEAIQSGKRPKASA